MTCARCDGTGYLEALVAAKKGQEPTLPIWTPCDCRRASATEAEGGDPKGLGAKPEGAAPRSGETP
jgi:hypothetical protein